jgi:dTDP-4-amino-4,6-dideoxygalactose transaminase
VFPTEQCLCEGEKQNAQSYSEGTILLPFVCQNGEGGHSWNQFVVRITGNKRRDVVKEKLAQKNIQTEIYYPRAMHNQKCFQAGPHPYPAVERFCEEILAFPGLNFPKPMDDLL